MSIDRFTALLLDEKISGAAVVDSLGKAIGVLSKTDLLPDARRVRPPDSAPPRVGDLMTPIAFTVAERAPVTFAAALMAHEGVHRLPVVSASYFN